MKGENEREQDVVRLHALMARAIATGRLPRALLEVTDKDAAALDPERVAYLKMLVKAGDLAAIDDAMRASAESLSGFNRGPKCEPKDAGLDAARERVRDRVRRQRGDSESPDAPRASS